MGDSPDERKSYRLVIYCAPSDDTVDANLSPAWNIRPRGFSLDVLWPVDTRDDAGLFFIFRFRFSVFRFSFLVFRFSFSRAWTTLATSRHVKSVCGTLSVRLAIVLSIVLLDTPYTIRHTRHAIPVYRAQYSQSPLRTTDQPSPGPGILGQGTANSPRRAVRTRSQQASGAVEPGLTM